MKRKPQHSKTAGSYSQQFCEGNALHYEIKKAFKYNLKMQLKKLEEWEQDKPKPSLWPETIEIRAGVNEIQAKKTIQRTNKSRSWVSEEKNKISRSLTQLAKRKDPN